MPPPEASPTYAIAVANRQRLLRIAPARLIAMARATLKAEGVKAAEISLAIVNDPEIRRINREFLGHDYATDVISFLLDSDGGAATEAAPRLLRSSRGADRTGKSIDGEIIISAETARARAGEFDWRPGDELALYLVHGLLHLCGYDDLTARDRRVMRRRESEILASLRIAPRSWNSISNRSGTGRG